MVSLKEIENILWKCLGMENFNRWKREASSKSKEYIA